MCAETHKPVQTFISYSHDTVEHEQRVLSLANRLRAEGIDVALDQYVEAPTEGWPQWMEQQISGATFVLVVCTPTYAGRLRGEQAGRGHGAKWEGALITQSIYEAEARNVKFIPVIFAPEDVKAIPLFLKGVTRYLVSNEEGYNLLYRRLTGQQTTAAASLGAVRRLGQSNVDVPIGLQRVHVPVSIVDGSIDQVRFNAFYEGVKAFVLQDQIGNSGGWARSQERVFEYTVGNAPGAIDRREGGIISTYIAVRALAGSGLDLVSHMEPGKSATQYLLRRQTKSGMFGRFSVSRSGEEIKPSYRHTALAILALMILDGPPEPITRGLDSLSRITLSDLADDAAPSIAISVILVALDVAANGGWGLNHLSSSQRKSVAKVQESYEHKFLQILESESKSPTAAHAPLWKPYGGSVRMLFDSALTTIDFLTVYSRPPWSTVCNALREIATHVINGALPYDPSAPDPDVGLSTYFSMICFRPDVIAQLNERGAQAILDTARTCLAFAQTAWETDKFSRRTYCDTVGNALLFRRRNS